MIPQSYRQSQKFYLSKVTMILLLAVTFVSPVLAQDAAIARVIKSIGDVKVKRTADADFITEMTAALDIFNGDAIRAGDGGFASLIFLDDKTLIKIKSNTEFQLVDASDSRMIDLQYGSIRSNLPSPQKDFRVQTPVSVASVKGTDFWIIHDRNTGIDRAYGMDGIVEVLNRISGAIQNLTANTMLISTSTGLMTPPIPIPDDEIPQDPPELQDDPPEPQPEPEGEAEGEGEGEGDAEELPAEEEPVDFGAIEDVPLVIEAAPVDVPTDVPADSTAEDGEEEPQADKGPGWGLGLGSVTIDEKVYYQLALRPELAFGKLKLGLDLVAYMDGKGIIRPDEWDEASDYLDKIYYLRWGANTDPFFFQIGALPVVQYGFGALMSNYSNMTEYPQVRKVGFEIGGKIGKNIAIKGFMANLKESGGLVGLRGTYTVSPKFPLAFGLNVVTDLNQYGGLKDSDGDNRPDMVDDFPDDELWWLDTDGDGWADADVENELDRDGDGKTDQYPTDPSREWDDDVVLKAEPFAVTDENKRTIMGYSFDISYPLVTRKLLTMTVYAEMAVINYHDSLDAEDPVSGDIFTAKSGSGVVGPGLNINLLNFINMSIEYRQTSPLFLPGFFNSTYDFERAQFVQKIEGTDTTNVAKTKDQLILKKTAHNMAGIYGSASASLFNLVTFSAAYQQLTSTEVDTVKSNSFIANLSLNTDKIPKISEARAYYIRTNDQNPFDFANPNVNTTWGYRLAYSLGPGVDLVYNQQVNYRMVNGEIVEVRLLSIETAFNF